MNIAVFGGTFDPIHNGHLAVADVVASRLAAQVVFVPAGQPWMKCERRLAQASDRLEMVRRAIDRNSRYSLSVVETERLGPSYTIDTIRQLKWQNMPCDELYFILGWDSLLSLPRWREPEALIQMCRIVAVPRVGYDMPDAVAIEKLVEGLSKRVVLLDEPKMDISSSGIRERVRQGLPLDNLLPQEVEGYIKEKGIYLFE
ncbi:MAG: nicotinate-nucleotide adenylyltransferase [Dehalococcoidia bacterium]|nr:nicotinate-nucleotide adenylyltransferase [Dehalococcoidia bacterium]